MTAICFTIERDLKQMMNDPAVSSTSMSAPPMAAVADEDSQRRFYYIL